MKKNMNNIHLFFFFFFFFKRGGDGVGQVSMTGQDRTGQGRAGQGDSLLGWTFIGENTKVSDDRYDTT